MAQMTCFASFGPVLLIVVVRRYIRSFRISSIPVWWLVDIINTNNNNKKLTNGPNDAKHVIWAHFPHRSLSVPSSSPQWVITTRWGLLFSEFKARGSPQCVEMTCWGCWCHFGGVKTEGKPPTSRNDLLGVLVPLLGVDTEGKPPDESLRLVGGSLWPELNVKESPQRVDMTR